MSFSANCNNLLYEIFYNYTYLWHVIANFGKIFFHAPIHYKAETKFFESVYKSVCVHAHAQTKRPTASKFGTELLERVFEKTSKLFFFKIDLDILKRVLKIYSWILVGC